MAGKRVKTDIDIHDAPALYFEEQQTALRALVEAQYNGLHARLADTFLREDAETVLYPRLEKAYVQLCLSLALLDTLIERIRKLESGHPLFGGKRPQHE